VSGFQPIKPWPHTVISFQLRLEFGTPVSSAPDRRGMLSRPRFVSSATSGQAMSEHALECLVNTGVKALGTIGSSRRIHSGIPPI
jgi:hypothetical protein